MMRAFANKSSQCSSQDNHQNFKEESSCGFTFDSSISFSRSRKSNLKLRPIFTKAISRLQTIEYKLAGVVPKNFAASRTFNNRTCSQLLSSCSPAIASPHTCPDRTNKLPFGAF